MPSSHGFSFFLDIFKVTVKSNTLVFQLKQIKKKQSTQKNDSSRRVDIHSRRFLAHWHFASHQSISVSFLFYSRYLLQSTQTMFQCILESQCHYFCDLHRWFSSSTDDQSSQHTCCCQSQQSTNFRLVQWKFQCLENHQHYQSISTQFVSNQWWRNLG